MVGAHIVFGFLTFLLEVLVLGIKSRAEHGFLGKRRWGFLKDVRSILGGVRRSACEALDEELVSSSSQSTCISSARFL